MLLAQSEILIQSIMKKYYKTIVKLVLLLSMKPTSKKQFNIFPKNTTLSENNARKY